MSAPQERRSAQRTVERVLAMEMARAEQRGAARVRAQLRATLEENRRVVRVSDQQVEVVEVAALNEVLDT